MTDTDPWRQALADLVSMGTVRGYVTYEELGERLVGIESDPMALEAVLRTLESVGVAVTDSPQDSPTVTEPGVEPPGETRHRDVLAAYERDLARVTPLEPEEEQRLAAVLRDAMDDLRAIYAAEGGGRGVPSGGPGRGEEDRRESVSLPYDWAWERLATNSGAKAGSPIMDAETLERMRRLVRVVEDVRGRLVQGTMRLVFHLARRYRDRGVEILDLVQEGNAGLLRAVQRYDPRRGHSFASYATWWIRQAMARAVREQAKSFKVPPGLDANLRRISLSRRKLTQSLQREPTAAELADDSGFDEHEVDALLTLAASPLRLDSPVGDDDDGSLEGMINLGAGVGQSPDGVSSVLREEIERVLKTLDPVEQDVMRLRHGLTDGTFRSLEDVAHLLKITRERAYRIEQRALKKLRHPERRRRLDQTE